MRVHHARARVPTARTYRFDSAYERRAGDTRKRRRGRRDTANEGKLTLWCCLVPEMGGREDAGQREDARGGHSRDELVYENWNSGGFGEATRDAIYRNFEYSPRTSRRNDVDDRG